MVEANTKQEAMMVWFKKHWYYLLTTLFTGFIAIIAIASHCNTSTNMTKQLELSRRANDSTDSNMKQQTAELKRATELQWRPFLNLTWMPETYYLGWLGDGQRPKEGDSVMIQHLNTIKLKTPEYESQDSLYGLLRLDITYHNTGKTPLRIVRKAARAFGSSDWVTVYEMSPEKLVADMLDGTMLDVDRIIGPDSAGPSTPLIRHIVVDKRLFEKALLNKKNLVLYTAAFIEYEDPFENQYNVLLVNFWRRGFVIRENAADYESDEWQTGLERMRWDVPVPVRIADTSTGAD